MNNRFKTLLVMFSALALGTPALLAPALAAPVLRHTVTVSSAIVTVGDMFDNAGLMAEEALFRAPAPGTTGRVALSAVRDAAIRIGLNDFENPGLSEISVARSGSIVGEDDLNNLIADELRSRGILSSAMQVRMTLARQLERIYAADTEQPVVLQDFRYLPGNTRFSARFMIAGQNQPLDLTGVLAFAIEAPHLTRPLSAGAVIVQSDIAMRPVSVQFADSTGSLTLEEVIGKQLNRQLREGIMVRPADISNPLVIVRNDEVTMLIQSGAMTLTVRGQALSDASRGDSISVLNFVSNRVVRGIATNPGTVEIRPANAAVASL